MGKELLSVVVEVEVAFVVELVVDTVVVDKVLDTVVVGGGVIPIPHIFPLQPHSPFVVVDCLVVVS